MMNYALFFRLIDKAIFCRVNFFFDFDPSFFLFLILMKIEQHLHVQHSSTYAFQNYDKIAPPADPS